MNQAEAWIEGHGFFRLYVHISGTRHAEWLSYLPGVLFLLSAALYPLADNCTFVSISLALYMHRNGRDTPQTTRSLLLNI